MANKKSKKHQKKNKKQNQLGNFNLLGIGTGQAGSTVLTALIAEVVAVTIDRLLQRVSTTSGNNQAGDANDSDRTPLAHVLSTLQPVLQTIGDSIKQPLQDAVATTKSVAQDVPSEVNQAVSFVQEQTPAAIAEPATRAKRNGAVLVGELVDTAKTVVDAINTRNADHAEPAPNEIDKPEKKKKKKHKQ